MGDGVNDFSAAPTGLSLVWEIVGVIVLFVWVGTAVPGSTVGVCVVEAGFIQPAHHCVLKEQISKTRTVKIPRKPIAFGANVLMNNTYRCRFTFLNARFASTIRSWVSRQR